MHSGEPRWWNRLSFRVWILVTVCVLLGDLITFPLWGWVAAKFHPELDPGWDEAWSMGEIMAYAGLSLGYGATMGAVLGWFASRTLMSRLRSIATQAADVRGDQLPGPFEEIGRDEVTQLARALNSMRGRVADLLARLADRDEKRGEWVAQVSHDLRTPLTALITSLEHTSVLLDRDGPTGEELRENNAAARIDVERVAALAEDLLEIARLEVDQSIDTEPVLAGEIIEQTLHGLEPLAKEARVRIEAEIEPELPVVEADGRLVLRALENLVLNSIQHARGWIRVSATRRGGWLWFTVEDDGDGLPETEGAVTFRELKTHRSRADSSGIGLIVAERVALAHGGRIEARNRCEGGAEVAFALPIT